MQTFSHDTLCAREAQLIEAARRGDASALIEYLYERLMARAVRLVNGFRDAYGVHLDAEDVAMEGALALLRSVEKALAVAHNPVAWLMQAAQRSMLHFCQENRSVIRVPARRQCEGKNVPQILSLDAPLIDGEDLTLLDLLPAEEAQASIRAALTWQRPACEMSEREAQMLEHPWYVVDCMNPNSDAYWQ